MANRAANSSPRVYPIFHFHALFRRNLIVRCHLISSALISASVSTSASLSFICGPFLKTQALRLFGPRRNPATLRLKSTHVQPLGLATVTWQWVGASQAWALDLVFGKASVRMGRSSGANWIRPGRRSGSGVSWLISWPRKKLITNLLAESNLSLAA